MKKILLIEDDQIMRENTAEMLELASYKVITAEDGKKGVALAKKENPDLVICDIQMPELDGYSVLYLLGKNPDTARIPFIFLTSKSEKEEVRKGMRMGADDYLSKPFEEMELLASIETRLKKSEYYKFGIENDLAGLNQLIHSTRDEEELKKLSVNKRIQRFKKKEMVFMEGDEAGNIIFIHKGKIKTFKNTSEGKELITGVHGSGEYIGTIDLVENKTYRESAMTMEDTEILMIPKQDFYSMIYSNRDLAVHFIHLLSNNMYELEERLLTIAYDSVRKRVADGLLAVQKKFTSGHSMEPFFISREDLASMVGIAHETISRTLHDFIDEHLIAVKDKQIVIMDEQKLKHMKN
ncbi:MAG: response regulator [Bacteroidetes bacterium]|nr:response regulator [Bacteroidota bacterium]